jgi:hypothetical protein
MPECPFCAQQLPAGARRCPLCEHAVDAAPEPATPTGAVEGEDGVYDLSNEVSKIPADWQSVAIYTLELPARCPNCREPIRFVRVLRMTRTQVAFTSALPRGGRAMVCPECERIISIELATFS